MKKYLIAIILILTFSSAAFSQDVETYDDFSAQSADQDVLFKSFMPDIMNTPEIEEEKSDIFYFDDDRQYSDIDPDNMPFFKQMRLKMTNKLYFYKII